MAEKIASLYAEIYADTSKLEQGLNNTKSGLRDTDKQFANTQNAAKSASSGFANFASALSSGKTTTADFTDSLLASAKAMGLSEGKTLLMAQASGLYSKEQISAASSSVLVSKKAEELATAVSKGEMSVTQAGKAFGEYAKAHQTAEKSQVDFGKTLKSLMTTMTAIVGVAAAAGVAIKKAFDWTREGAAIIQTKEGFASMLATIGEGPGILNEWRAAVDGTISDLDIMSGYLTTTAGLSAEVTRSFTENNTALLRIAKAAATLNPQLGDTAYMYQSITLGLKRLQPKIIDNLGLQVKVSEANEKLAATLGKSADQLTAEEQQMALLNATIEAGDRLIAQLGGTIESATDPWDQFTAAWKNQRNAAKEANVLTGRYEKTLGGLTRFIDNAAKRQNALNEALSRGAITQEEYSWAVNQHGNFLMTSAEVTEWATDKTEEFDKQLKLAGLDAGYYSDMLAMAGKATGNLASTSEVALASMTDKYTAMFGMMGTFADTTDEVNEKQEELAGLLSLQADQGYGYFDGQWLSASALKDKIIETQDEINALKEDMASFANQTVIDMAMAAAAADGIITPKEFEDVIDLQVALGEMSTEAADTMIEEFNRAFGVWEGLQYPDKFVNVFVKFHNMGTTIPVGNESVTINPKIGEIPKTNTPQLQALGGFYETSTPTDFRSSETNQPETAIFVPQGKSIYDVATPQQVAKVMPGGGMGNVTNNYYFEAVEADQIPQTIEQLKVLAL